MVSIGVLHNWIMFVKSWKSPLAMALGLLVIPVMLVYAADDDLYFSPEAVSQIPDIRDLVGYQPASSMFDQSRIDLDMAMMNSLLADIETAAAFPSEMYDASRIYSNGAFSKSYASVSLKDPLPLDLPDGTPLVATRNEDYDGTVLGLVLDDTPKGSTSLKFQYDFFADTNSTALSCYVGGLAKGDAFVEGCLALNGTISVDTRNENTVPIITMAYSYSIEQNLNDRSLSKFSSDAQTLMYQCPQCPYNTYQKFYDYYGAYDYANKFINMAIDAGTTSFDMGSADFAFVGLEGRAGTFLGCYCDCDCVRFERIVIHSFHDYSPPFLLNSSQLCCCSCSHFRDSCFILILPHGMFSSHLKHQNKINHTWIQNSFPRVLSFSTFGCLLFDKWNSRSTVAFLEGLKLMMMPSRLGMKPLPTMLGL